MKIDSLKVRFPMSCVQDFSPAAYETIETNSVQYAEPEIKYRLNVKKPLGIKDISFNQTKGFAILEMSAKVLKENYFKLIDCNTIQNAFDNVNASGLIRINTTDAIEQSQVLKCDVTSDLAVSNIPHYLGSLSAYQLNQRYECKRFPTSIAFARKVKTKSLMEYQKFYCKHSEIKRDTELLKFVPVSKAKNILRCESRLATFQQMRNAFSSLDLSLTGILNNNANPNLRTFNRITQELDEQDYFNIQNFKELIGMKGNYSFRDVQKEIAMFSILKMCNYDIELVKVFLATNSTSNNSRLLRQFKERLKAKADFELSTIDRDISNIRTLLNAA